MNHRITRGTAVLLAVIVVLSGAVVAVSAQETTSDLSSDSLATDTHQQLANNSTSKQQENAIATTSGDQYQTSATQLASNELQLTASAGSTYTFGAGTETVSILVGASDTSGTLPNGVSNVSLTIEITAPDGTLSTYNRTTGANGLTTLSVTPDLDGEYDVSVSSSETGDWGHASFTHGMEAVVFPGWHEAIEVDHQVQVGIGVLDDGQPVSQQSQSVTIETPSGTQSRSVTTQANGIATLQFTPQEAGEYTISSNDSIESARLQAGSATAKAQFNTPWADNTYPNQTVALYGQVMDDGLPYENEDVVIEIQHWDKGTVRQLSTTTNAYGQYLVTWTPSESLAQSSDYLHMQVTTPGGDIIGTSESGIDLEQPDTETAPDSNLDIRLEENWGGALSPGSTGTIDVTVTENETPVSGTVVDLRGVVERGAVLTSGSVTTDATGQATYQVTIPSDAPDGTSFNVEAATTVGGETVTETEYSDLRYVDVTDEHDYSAEPNTDMEYSISASDASTGDPVSSVPTFVFLEKNAFNASIVSSGLVTTDSSGEGATQLPVGAKTGELMINDWGPYASENYFSSVDSTSYDVSTTGLENEYAAGGSVSFTYETSTDSATAANVLVAAGDDDAGQTEYGVLHTQQASPGETITFSIPAGVSDDIDYDVTVAASTSIGERTVSTDHFSITAGTTQNTPPTAAFSYSPITPNPGENVTLDASSSADTDGSIVQYKWDIDGDGVTDYESEDPTHLATFDSPGSYPVTLTVTDNEGKTASVTETIIVREEGTGPGDVTGNGNAAVDPDGDGKFEDLTGDGNVDARDVLALWNNRNSLSPQSFDFTNDGSVDARDVLELWNQR